MKHRNKHKESAVVGVSRFVSTIEGLILFLLPRLGFPVFVNALPAGADIPCSVPDISDRNVF